MPEIAQEAARSGDPHEFLDELRNSVIMLRRRWRIVAVSVLVCVTFAVLYLAGARRYYQATTRVLILQQGGRPLNVGSNDTTHVVEPTDDLLATHGMIVSSPLVVGRAIQAIGREDLPTLAEAEDPVKAAVKLLKVTRPDRMARILEISFQAYSRDEALRMVDAVTESYRKFLEDTYQKSSHEVVSLIRRARDDLGNELTELEEKYAKMREQSAVPLADSAGNSYLTKRLERWDQALVETAIKSTVMKAQLALGKELASRGTELWAIAHAVSQLGGDASSLTATMTARTTYNGAIDYVRQLEQEQHQLAERHGPQLSKVQELQEQITRVKQRTRDARARMEAFEVRDLLDSLAQGLRSVDGMRAELVAALEGSRSEVKRVELDMLEEESLRDKLERQRALFNTVVDQLKQAQFISDFSTISSETIEPANALRYPVYPRNLMTLVAAVLVGAMLGAGLAAVVDRFDQRIRSIEELRRALGLPVLGQVPYLTPSQAAAAGQVGLIGRSMPHSPCAEAYRAIRTNLEFLRRNRTVRVILVTSPHSGDGKSTVASNLAVGMAHLGRRVLLVDADLRKPNQDRIHGLPRLRGLTHVVRRLLPLGRVVQRTSVENLDLLTTGPQVPNPAELLMSPGMGEFLDEARAAYDLVIIDSSPMLAVTDASVIGSSVDGVLLVVSLNGLSHTDVERTRELLEAMGAFALGVAINQVRRDNGGYGYGYGYGDTEAETPDNETDSTRDDPEAREDPAYRGNGHADAPGPAEGPG
ncbi:MAG: polysaccharide biosynthesis tyrosine autokinase [Isosphaeraceae bacterium]